MITLKTSGYTPEDFELIKKSLKNVKHNHVKQAKRACDDLKSLLYYVIEKQFLTFCSQPDIMIIG